MRRTNINAVLRMVKQFLTGKIDATSTIWWNAGRITTMNYPRMISVS